jgi:hypothetical protein
MASVIKRNDRLISVGVLLASMLLTVSAIWMPWATYRTGVLTLSFRSGWLDVLLVTCGVVALVLAGLSFSRKSPALLGVLSAIACVAVVTSIALAIASIKDANDIAMIHASSSQTSYGIGSVVGVAASVLLAVLSVMEFKSVRSQVPRLATTREDLSAR